jgi:hypothetical protein
MTSPEIIELIEHTLRDLPDRMSGNEASARVAQTLRGALPADRAHLIQAMRSYLQFRVSPEKRQPADAVPESRLWMALEVAAALRLTELKPDVETLLEDVRQRKVLLPVHGDMVASILQRLN